MLTNLQKHRQSSELIYTVIRTGKVGKLVIKAGMAGFNLKSYGAVSTKLFLQFIRTLTLFLLKN